MHEMAQVCLFAHLGGGFAHVHADVYEDAEYLALLEGVVSCQQVAEVGLHVLAARVVVQAFQDLHIIRHLSNKRLTRPDKQPLHTPSMPRNLQEPEPPTALPQPDHTFKHQVMIGIQQGSGERNDLLVVEKSLV